MKNEIKCYIIGDDKYLVKANVSSIDMMIELECENPIDGILDAFESILQINDLINSNRVKSIQLFQNEEN